MPRISIRKLTTSTYKIYLTRDDGTNNTALTHELDLCNDYIRTKSKELENKLIDIVNKESNHERV